MALVSVPVDLAFTVATTAIADLLKNAATTALTAGAGGNGGLKALTDGGFTLAALGIGLPGVSELCWVQGYNLEVDAPCIVQLGYLNAAGDAFTPFDTHQCTLVAAGGIVKNQFPGSGFTVPLATAVRLCLRVSGYGSATAVRVSGNLDIYRNN